MTTARRSSVAAALLLAVGLGVVAWLLLRRPAGPPADLAGAAAANARGVALMERFRYADAAAAFGEAVALAPGFLPARVNRGIALYNEGGGSDDARSKESNLSRGADEFRAVLAVEPDNVAAHYNLGIVALELGDLAEANAHFSRVTELDPADPHGWLLRARTLTDATESPDAKKYLETALRLNPYLNPARYALAQHTLTDEAGRTKLLAEFSELMAGNADVEYRAAYSDMGRYALVGGTVPTPPPGVGPLPLFEPADPKLTVPVAWAAADKLGAGPAGDLRRAVRTRFGGTLVRLDIDGDGRPDLLFAGAAADGRDVLLHNDGDGKFTPVDLGATASLGAAAGDFDNDGRPDLVLTGPTGVKLLRNGGGRFDDVTVAAGLGELAGAFLGAGWCDVDQDGDLDLLLCRYAADPAAAAAGLTGPPPAGGGLVVALNVGEALPAKDKNAAPLATKFRVATAPDALLVTGPAVAVVVTDLDGDLDPDLVVLRDGRPPATVLNDRIGRFRAGPDLPGVPAGRYSGGLALDANGDDQFDPIVLPADGAPLLLASTREAPDEALATRFAAGATDAPPMRQATEVDLDLDGRADLLGVGRDGKPVLAQGQGGGKLLLQRGAFPDLPPLLAATVCDLDGDCVPDLVGWADTGPVVRRGRGTGYSPVRVSLSGRRERREPGAGRVLRSNADGLGSRLVATAGGRTARVELLTRSAGLGQSLGPVDLGVGPARSADVRVRWPDALVQAELDQPACQLLAITETSRKPTSCPVLFAWDGERFGYVTDCLGVGALGELQPDGSVRPPRPWEAVKIEPHQLAPRDGRYAVKLAEPMDEVMYLDRLRLDVIDHPAAAAVFPDERFSSGGPPATGDLLHFPDADRLFPVRATDHAGRDVLPTLKDRDGRRTDGFTVRSWLGYAEEHSVTLDFGDRLKGLPAGRRLFLVLAGWTDYAYPESIFAATQAGLPTVAPVLEQRQADGTWKKLADVGFPAGLPRVMTRDVSGLIDPAGGPVRIRSNLRVYWDQVFLAPAAAPPPAVSLPVARATLAHRGFAQEVSPGGKPPVEYDDGRVEPVAVTPWHGHLTRTGEVTPLLAEADDRLVVAGPGDEVTAEFDAGRLPPVPAGAVRAFVLRVAGYCKDTAPTTVTGGRVGPLPFAAMPGYPYPPAAAPPGQADYEREWNTRPARGRAGR